MNALSVVERTNGMLGVDSIFIELFYLFFQCCFDVQTFLCLLPWESYLGGRQPKNGLNK